MRGAKAKRLRREYPERPNPGRKRGGADKTSVNRAGRWLPAMPRIRFRPRAN